MLNCSIFSFFVNLKYAEKNTALFISLWGVIRYSHILTLNCKGQIDCHGRKFEGVLVRWRRHGMRSHKYKILLNKIHGFFSLVLRKI